jgi:hypothetical protein
MMKSLPLRLLGMVQEIQFYDEEGDYKIKKRKKNDSIRIFSGVVQCVLKFLHKENPDRFFFSAKESSRKKLYDRFEKMLLRMKKYKKVINKEVFHKVKNNMYEPSGKCYCYEKI